MLVISTPSLEPSGYFYDLWANPKPAWTTFKTSCYDSKRVSPQWIEDRKEEWGEDSIQFQARVMGEFPAQGSETTLIPLSWIESAMDRFVPDIDQYDITFGIDVARKGTNESVIAVGSKRGIHKLITGSFSDSTKLISWIVSNIRDYMPHQIKIDADGVGGPICDQLKSMGFKIVELYSQSVPYNKDYLNGRAEWWFHMKDLLSPSNNEPIFLPRDGSLLRQLSTISYGFNNKGKIKIESKEDLEKRELPSPDRADASVYCLANIVNTRSMVYSPRPPKESIEMVDEDGSVQTTQMITKGGVLIRSRGGWLPEAVEMPRRKTSQPTCASCGKLCTIHNSMSWYCDKCNTWTRADIAGLRNNILR